MNMRMLTPPIPPLLPSSPHLSTSGSLPTSLQTHEHDDVGFPLHRVPDRHTGVQQLAELVEHGGLDDPAPVQAGSHVLKVNCCPNEGV